MSIGVRCPSNYLWTRISEAVPKTQVENFSSRIGAQEDLGLSRSFLAAGLRGFYDTESAVKGKIPLPLETAATIKQRSHTDHSWDSGHRSPSSL